MCDLSEVQQCKDMDIMCQQWARDGECVRNDIIRHFCAVSCRSPKCITEFPVYTRIDPLTGLSHFSNTACNYAETKDRDKTGVQQQFSLYQQWIDPTHIEDTSKEDVQMCMEHCDENLFCTHFFFVQRISAHVSVDEVVATTLEQRRTHYGDMRDACDKSELIGSQSFEKEQSYYNLCVLSYVPECRPVCVDTELLQQLSTPYPPNTSSPLSTNQNPLLLFNQVSNYIPIFTLTITEPLSDLLQQDFYTLSTWNGVYELSLPIFDIIYIP
ncbi:hypothetical protein RFI_27698 [Reticulomyxa filosa]|uniref:ShKT domain-containing protein n=1 Tax=Reticulomyxa filosa TaxID=46433 RepID=X6M882_RETFI|nr:hypothetical protein RFI_27698 [Reticulomyxa filosa]|eukprot:ETO09677.1 hypothetical protein RFI_27698 [Reticulomyxa filosa]